MDYYGSNPMGKNMSHGMNMRPWAEPNNMQDRNSQLAIARVVVQSNITQVYSTDTALKQGTLFPELDKRFTGKRGVY